MGIRRQMIRLAIEDPHLRVPLLDALRKQADSAAVQAMLQRLRVDLDTLWEDLDYVAISDSSLIPWATDQVTGVRVMFQRLGLVELLNNTIDRLLKRSEAGRVKRAKGVKIIDFRNDAWSQITAEATTKDWKIVYYPRIIARPRPVFACTCPDATNRRGKSGPCKHVIALGRFWQEDSSESGLLGTLVNLRRHVDAIRADIWNRA